MGLGLDWTANRFALLTIVRKKKERVVMPILTGFVLKEIIIYRLIQVFVATASALQLMEMKPLCTSQITDDNILKHFIPLFVIILSFL
jgi:hypothetical protein